jgi:F0F1-type ATP synthase assembly protein I
VPTLKEEEKEKLRKGTRNWMKYSGMAFQMIGVLLAFVFGGIYLDEWLGSTPWATVVLSLLGVTAGLYVSLRDFI